MDFETFIYSFVQMVQPMEKKVQRKYRRIHYVVRNKFAYSFFFISYRVQANTHTHL